MITITYAQLIWYIMIFWPVGCILLAMLTGRNEWSAWGFPSRDYPTIVWIGWALMIPVWLVGLFCLWWFKL